MNGKKVSAKDGSVAVGGNVNAPLVNVNASDTANVNLTFNQQIARELPSFLGAVIVRFSQDLSAYGIGPRQALTAEVIEKLEYNNLSKNLRVITDYRQHVRELEQAYVGVEQQNADARRLVRRKAAIAYESYVHGQCEESSPAKTKIEYAKTHADTIVYKVIDILLNDYKEAAEIKVAHEIAHLAISLIVFDAVVECEVLERP